MSRDWTPHQFYLVEKHNIAHGRGDQWDFMRSLAFALEGQEPERAYSDEEIALRQQYPVIGKFLDPFADLYKRLSEFPGGVEFLREKDAELSAYIENKTENPESYVIRWFEGKLDPNFYYSERNNELFISEICKDAISRGMKNWIVTDPDCLQVRRQVGFEFPGVYQLMQLQICGDCACQLQWAEIDIDDFDGKEIQSILNAYGYDSLSQLSKMLGDRREAYGQLAEMIFETHSSEFVVKRFPSWNKALEDVAARTGLDLAAYREDARAPLSEQIVRCSEMVVDQGSGADNIEQER